MTSTVDSRVRLGAVELPEDVRDRLSRRARVEEMADLLRELVPVP